MTWTDADVAVAPQAAWTDEDVYQPPMQQRTPANVAAGLGDGVGINPNVERAAGLTLRGGLQGVGDMLDTLALPFRGALNAFGADIQGRTGAGVSDLIGLPQAATPQERFSEAATEAMSGGAIPILAGQKLMQTVQAAKNPAIREHIARLLADHPQFQTVLNAFAGLGGQAAEERGAGAWGQMAASMAAPLAATVAAKGVSTGGRKVWDALGPVFSKTEAELAAGRIGADIAGDRAPQVVQAMTAADPMLTAGQASAGVGSAEMAGLERIIGSHYPSTYGPHGTIPTGQQRALQDMWDQLNMQMGPQREAALTAANASGTLNVAPLSMEVAALRSNPNYMDKTARAMFNWLDTQLAAVADRNTGEVNARALYAVRKDLGDEIARKVKAGKWNHTTSAALLRDVQKSIDWEIDNAIGAAPWRSASGQPRIGSQWSEGYMQPFAEGARPINQLEDLQVQATEMGAAGAPKAREIVRMDEAPLGLPSLFDRGITMLNALLRRGQGYGGEQTTQRLGELLQPREKAQFGKLIAEELRRREGRVGFGTAMQRAGRAGLYNEGLGD